MVDRITDTLKSEFDVVGVAGDGLAALAAAEALDPDVVVLDISMPALNGIQTAERLRDAGSRSSVVVLTVHEDSEFVGEAFGAGARGYVVKSCLDSDLPRAIREVHQGRFFISPSIHHHP